MTVEEIVIGYLNDVSDYPAYGERPESPDDRYFIVQRTGGGTHNKICAATLAIQSYAPTKAEAAGLNEHLEDVMEGITELELISHCNLNSSYDFTNVAAKQPRYQAVYDVVFYH